jgi:hypothetical protein
VVSSGDRVAQTFDAVGAYPYHCTVHAGMTGEVDVRRVTLGPLPVAAVPAGDPVVFSGRTADPGAPVAVERDTGDGFRAVGTAASAGDGTWKTTLSAQATGSYRASVGGDTSQSRRLVVSDRKVLVRATSRGVAVTVTPAMPYARVVLQLDLRERFGWWPVIASRLDYVSDTSFRVGRPVRLRVVLVDTDGWTAIATSPVVNLGRVPHRTPGPHKGH